MYATTDLEMTAILEVLNTLDGLDRDGQQRILDYVASRLQVRQDLQNEGGLLDSVGDIAGLSGAANSLFGMATPQDIFSLIGVALSAVGGTKLIIDSIRLWIDRKNGRKIRIKKGDFEIEFEGDVSIDEISNSIEDFKRIRDQLNEEPTEIIVTE